MLTPEVQAEILALHYAEKRSTRSIAKQFGVTRSSVRKLIARRSVRLAPKIGIKSSLIDPFKDEVKRLFTKRSKVSGHGDFKSIAGAWVLGRDVDFI